MKTEFTNNQKPLQRSFGKMYKESLQFRELQEGLIELIELSRITRNDKMKAASCNPSNYYRHLNDKNFAPKHLLGMIKLIVEHDNLEIAKNKFRNVDE
jgi:hypothetical protein